MTTTPQSPSPPITEAPSHPAPADGLRILARMIARACLADAQAPEAPITESPSHPITQSRGAA